MKKIMSLVLIVMLMVLTIGSAVAAPGDNQTTISASLDRVETALYGKLQKGALLERVAGLEKELFGQPANSSLMARVERIENYVLKGANDQYSLALRLNVLEWAILHNVTSDPLKNRLENLEKVIGGTVSGEAIDVRMTKITKLALPNGSIRTNPVGLPADVLLKVKLLTPLNSEVNRVGDSVDFQVVEDVTIDGLLVIPAGSMGKGVVSKAEAAKNFGRDGKIEVDFQTVNAMDNLPIAVFLGDKAKEQTKSMALAAGASVAGMALLGPVGIIGGIFVHGNELKIPEGTQLYVQTKAQIMTTGVKM